MNLSESYKKRLQELSGIPQEYQDELDRLGIEKFEDLEGATVQYVKPSYGEHTVLKWLPDTLEYLLFTGGQKVLAPPQRIKIIDKKPIDVDTELKWVIRKLCEEENVKSIDIQYKNVDDDAVLTVIFNIITVENHSMWGIKSFQVEVLYEDVTLELKIKNNNLSSYYVRSGPQSILKSGNEEQAPVGPDNWREHAPFIGTSYHTSQNDWTYMAKIIEKIILDMI